MHNILFVLTRSIFPPEKGDARLCFYRSEHLSRLGYKVSVLQILPSVLSRPLRKLDHNDLAFDVYVVRISYLRILLSLFVVLIRYPQVPLQSAISKSTFLSKSFKQFLPEIRPDIVHFLTARTFFLWLLLPSHMPVVRDFIDSYAFNYLNLLESSNNSPRSLLEHLSRFYYQIDSKRFLSLEKNELYPSSPFHRSLYVSPRDIAFLHNQLSEIPNLNNPPQAIPIGLVPFTSIPNTSPLSVNASSLFNILFYGTLSYPPNLQAALFLLKQIYPRLLAEVSHFRIIIAGRNAPRHLQVLCNQLANVKLISPVTDMPKLIQSVDVVCAPVSIGSGLQFKIIEPMSARVPVISSTFCASGFAIPDGQYCLVAKTAADYVRHIKYLKHHPSESLEMVQRAFEFSQSYTWQCTAQQLSDLYRSIK